MHIMEGFLPPMWALAWWLLFLPCLWYGLVRLRRLVQEDNNQKVLLARFGAFIFVLSALKIPSVTGSCSHPTGVGLAVILFGPGVVAILGAIVLLFQALLLRRFQRFQRQTAGEDVLHLQFAEGLALSASQNAIALGAAAAHQ